MVSSRTRPLRWRALIGGVLLLTDRGVGWIVSRPFIAHRVTGLVGCRWPKPDALHSADLAAAGLARRGLASGAGGSGVGR
jgi:hypothetical protein